MPATTYTLTGNIRDALRTDASELQNLQGYLEPSQVAIADTTDNTVSLGNVALGIDPATGAFSVALLGTGAAVAGWRLVLLWRDSSLAASGRQQQQFTSGYFTMTSNRTLVDALTSSLALVAVDTTVLQSVYVARDAVLAAGTIPLWAPSTAYTVKQAVINPRGQVVFALATFMSGATYVASNWTSPSGAPKSSAPTSASSGTGWRIASRSLDRYRASAASSDNFLAEVVIFGDSTTQGSGDDQGGYVPELRRLARAGGYSDGGQGIARFSMTALESGDNLAPVLSNTGFGGNGNQFDIYNANTPISSATGNTITFQGRGTRLRMYYTSQAAFGRFTYSVDGASAVTVDTKQTAFTSRVGVVDVSGLSEGLHRVVITNIGAQGPTRPTINNVLFGSPGSTGFSSGTFYYVVTAVTGGGETLPSDPMSITIPNGPRTIGVTINRFDGPPSVTSYKFYRSTSGAAGSYQLVGSIAQFGGANGSFTDDNTATPGATAPASNTSGITGATDAAIHVDTEWIRSSGLVLHNNGVSGAIYGSYFNKAPANLDTSAQASLGITQGGTPTTDYQQPPAPRPPWRAPVLAICALGINDQQGSGGTTAGLDAGLQNVKNGAEKFAQFCVATNCDGVLVSPHFARSAYGTTAYQGSTAAAVFAKAISDVAVTYGISYASFDAALDAAGYAGSGPHIDHVGYVIEANFLWVNILAK